MMARRRARSASVGRFGSPQGWGILVPVTMRLTLSCIAMEDIAVMKATGIPSFSSARAIADPLRVHEPQVDTSRAPSTPFDFISMAISFPSWCITESNPRAPGVP